MRTFIYALAFLSFSAFAETSPAPSAKVEKLVGSAVFNGKEIKEGQVLDVNGTIETKKRAFIRLAMPIWNSSIVIGPETQMKLDLTSPKDKNPKRYELTNGLCRWISSMKSNQLKGSHVHTKSAALGVRGTDFEVQNRKDSGETEIIVFDGEVLLQSKLASSEQLVKKGQWGGVGGKFGKVIAKPIDVPEDALKKAKERSAKAAPSSAPPSDSDSDYQ
ncbi:MAG TPA: FecR domain-containing protein [Bdellovibrionota bacterium]|jgi:hypothetical protein